MLEGPRRHRGPSLFRGRRELQVGWLRPASRLRAPRYAARRSRRPVPPPELEGPRLCRGPL